MAKKKITEIAEEVLEGFLTENNYELYSIEFIKATSPNPKKNQQHA